MIKNIVTLFTSTIKENCTVYNHYPDGVGQETEGNPVIQLHHILEKDTNFEAA